MTPIPERHAIDRATFEAEIVGGDTPVVLRGLLADWPLVRAARQSTEAFAGLLGELANDVAGETWVADPAVAGRFGFTEGHRGYNHDRKLATIDQLLDLLLRQRGAAAPYAMFAGALPVARHLPTLRASHPMPLLDEARELLVSLWLGNRTKTAAHFDYPHNLACVVAGRRRFTLFPTDQARNLYVGPLEVTLAGQPSSLVDVEDPDLDRFPRFAEAAEAALVADLDPGDVLYIPSLWWHAVRSLDEVGAMVNYWWRDNWVAASPFPALLHALGAVAALPANERARWQALFDQLAFAGDDAHLPEALRPSGISETARQRIIRSLGGTP